MATAQHYVPNEKIVWEVTMEMVLDIRLDDIERAFPLSLSDSCLSISYEEASWWYRKHQVRAHETIQRRYLL